MKKYIPIVLVILAGCASPRSGGHPAGPWNIQATPELEAVWIRLEPSITKQDWPAALSCCTSETQTQAQRFSGSMQEFFQPLLDLKISFGRLGFSDAFVITFWLTEDAVPPYLPFVKEDSKWKFMIPKKRK